MTAWWWGVPLAALSFCLQTWPRWFNRYFGVDVWRHIDEAMFIREHRRLNTGPQERYLIDRPTDYPPLLRLLLALFPRRWLDEWQWAISPAIDAVHNLLLFAVLLALTGEVRVAWLGQLFYLASPIVILENSNLTTRPLGSLTFTLAVWPLVLFLAGDGWAWWGIAVIGVAILCLAHRMSLQALIAVAVLFTVVERSAWPLLAVAAGMAAALLLSRGFYWQVLRGHLAMLKFWSQNIQYKVAHQVRGVPKRGERNPDMVFRINHWLKDSHLVAIVGANPWIPVMAVLYYGVSSAHTLVLDRCAVWVVGLVVVGWAIRQLHALRFLGEGERYVEYASFPTAVVLSLTLWSVQGASWFAWLVAGCVAVFIGACLIPTMILQYLVILKDVERSVTPALQKVLAYLERVPEEVRLFTVPLYLITPAMHWTRCRVVSTDNSTAHVTDIQDFAPYLKKPLPEILQRYRVNYLLMSERYVSLQELEVPQADIVFTSGPYRLLRLRVPSASQEEVSPCVPVAESS